MKYLCLVYHEEAKTDALPEWEYDAILGEVLDYREELWQSGHYIASSPLQPVEMATTIRVRHGKLAVTDGPFAETKEQLGGFYLIEARDLNDAIRVASKMPSVRLGCIEVRPLVDFTFGEACGMPLRAEIEWSNPPRRYRGCLSPKSPL